MQGLEGDTIGGFNSLLNKQKNQEGSALVSTILFNGKSEVIHDRVEIKDVKPMTLKDYCVGGCTALLDALGGAIKHINNIHKYARKEDIPSHTMFIIITDGMENASRFFTKVKIKQMIELQKEKFGWEFIFLGANIDAVEVANDYGINADRAVNYTFDSVGTTLNYKVINEAINTVRVNKPLMDDWKEEIEKDYKARNK